MVHELPGYKQSNHLHNHRVKDYTSLLTYLYLSLSGMIPPSPPSTDQDDLDPEGQDEEDTGHEDGNDGSIRFQVTLEEGDEESIGGI